MDRFGLLNGLRIGSGSKRWTAIVALTLAACGGGEQASAPPGTSVSDESAARQVVLAAPQLSEDRERILLTWQAWPEARVTVHVQRMAGGAFEAVEADISGSNGEFVRGPAWRWDFPSAQVQVRACDPSNFCATSNSQPLLEPLIASVARILPPPEMPKGNGFAEQILLSRDGRTLAMGNSQDKLAGRPLSGAGSVWVYQRGTDGQWLPEARLNRFERFTAFGHGLAMSSDGSTIAVGAHGDGGSIGGVNAPEVGSYFIDPSSPGESSGAVYVFSRDEQRQWQLQAFIKAAVPVTGEQMGWSIALSSDGNRMIVSSFFRVYVFERSGSAWRQARIIEKRSSTDTIARVVMSSDGTTLAISGSDSTGARVLVYRHCTCGDGWRLAATLRSAKPGFNDGFSAGGTQFDRPVSLSANGKVLAVGASRDHGDIGDLNVGVEDPPAQGSIYVFGEDVDGVWRRHAYLRTRSAADFDSIGRTVELDAEGQLIATKGCGHAANDSGVRRNHRAGATVGASSPSCAIPENNEFGGAVYLFERDAAETWTHAAAAIPSPGIDKFFDMLPIALSGNAETFASGGVSITPELSTLTMEVY
jgi:hypothetical protein